MLISCKCLNFIASSNSQQHQQKLNSSATVATADASTSSYPASSSIGPIDEDCSMSSSSSVAAVNGSTCHFNSLSTTLMQAFLQKYPRTFPFYSQCMDFFKQSIGPISDLAINAVNQRDLVYSITLEIKQSNNNPISSNHSPSQAWQISICINCNTVLCAKRIGSSNQSPDIAGDQQPNLQSQQQQYLINCSLLTNNEELMQRRSDKSFSETFGLLIIDHPQQMNDQQAQSQNSQGTSGFNFTVGSFSMGAGSAFTLDPKQQRLKQLQHNLQTRLQKEIADTDERIQRYTEQQFALLKSFREKSDQEFQLLANQIQRVPDNCELLDKSPPALDVNSSSLGLGAGSYAQRRRNTIGSRRDLITSQPTTPTTLTLLPSSFLSTTQSQKTMLNSSNSAIDGTNYSQQFQAKQGQIQAPNNQNSGGGSFAVINQRKMSNFDTPPATPEATPMSVGNSPTFRQQQQQQSNSTFVGRLSTSNSFQQQFPTPTVEAADDCLFELEGVENQNTSNPIVGGFHQHNMSAAVNSHHQQYHRTHHEMSDVDESDSAEEAEDALDLDSSVPIPMKNSRRGKSGMHDMLNFAKSLPIQIANSPLADRAIADDSDEDELDNTVDIAASIKALAKSVHGEAVFGDLPRPRLRSQI